MLHLFYVHFQLFFLYIVALHNPCTTIPPVYYCVNAENDRYFVAEIITVIIIIIVTVVHFHKINIIRVDHVSVYTVVKAIDIQSTGDSDFRPPGAPKPLNRSS